MNPVVHRFELSEKFSEKQLDQFIKDFFAVFKKNGSHGKYIFDLSALKWIANQNLLFIAAIWKYLIVTKTPFFVNFLPVSGVPLTDQRQARQFVYIWDVWKIYLIAGNLPFDKFFDIDGKYIDSLKRDFNLKSTTQKVYEHYGITPLIVLDHLYKYSDSELLSRMNEVLVLDAATNDILKLNNCSFPFENNTVNYIIIKELYENFLDHFSQGIFSSNDNYAFMSLALSQRLSTNSSGETLQQLLRSNFYSEYDNPFIEFFTDKKSKSFKNRSFLQMSFIDFGEGIPQTLRPQYRRYLADRRLPVPPKDEDSLIIQYAFRFDSSRHPLPEKYSKNTTIPRGLFDLLSIVKRYDGIIVVRSGTGKVLFDFSVERDIKSSVKFFDGQRNLPGTMVTVYIPERDQLKKIDTTVIKPVHSLPATAGRDRKEITVNMFKFQKDLQQIANATLDKQLLYEHLFRKLQGIFHTKSFNILYTVDFTGYEIDERIAKKIIYFLISDYSINLHHNVLVVNPPPKEFLRQVNFELLDLTEVDRKFRIHPTPFIYTDEHGEEIEIFWLGIYDESDLEKLKYIQAVEHGYSRGDFNNPEDIVGHVNYYDEQGNLISVINSELVYNRFLRLRMNAKKRYIQKYFERFVEKAPRALFLMPQNFYQEEYINPNIPVNDNAMCRYLADALYLMVDYRMRNMKQVKFLTLSKSAVAIMDIFYEKNPDIKKRHIAIERSHFAIDHALLKQVFSKGDNIFLVCECVYSGDLVRQVNNALPSGALIRHVVTFINTLTPEVTDSNPVFKEILSVYHRPIEKLSLEGARNLILAEKYDIIRIDHKSGSTLRRSFSDNNTSTSNLINSVDDFIMMVRDDHIKAGYYKFNNLVHPYFFDMEQILKDDVTRERLLSEIFPAFERRFPEVLRNISALYYPKNSAIKFVPPGDLKNKYFKNELLEIVELDRQPTRDGWRYTHIYGTVQESNQKIKVMIFDDGCCTGESLIQMIDDLALLNVSHIYILTIISRLTEHKREMFSRMRQIEGRFGSIFIDIVFGVHWYVPTYGIYDSPISAERNWLDQVKRIQNLPTGILSVCKNVLDELELKNIVEANNKFLLKTKDGQDIVKQLVRVKNEVGKMASYRLYEDYFDFFDETIRVYLSEEIKEKRYRPFELLCGVFLHEPYVYKSLKRVIPDITAKIALFASTLMTGNYLREDNKVLRKKKLIYEWSYKNILHLFFVVYSDSQLFDFLTPDRMLEMVKRFGTSEKDLNYVLYNLLKYIPISSDEMASKPYAGRVLALIALCIDSPSVGEGPKRQLKRFRSFITSLPYSYSSFEKQLNTVSGHYAKLDDDANHKYSFSAQYDTLKMKLMAYEIHESKQALAEANTAWELMSEVIQSLLMFSKSYPDFFGPVKGVLYRNIEYSDRSLRSLFGQAGEMFTHINPLKAGQIMGIVEDIHDRFFLSATECYQIFHSITTPDILRSLYQLTLEIASKLQKTGLLDHPKFDQVDPIPVAVPQHYIDSYLVPEIAANFRNADLTKNVKIDWEVDRDYVRVKIQNYISNNPNKVGGGSGMETLKAFTKIPGKICMYDCVKESELFIQTIHFKKTLK